jgi:transposase
MRRKPATPNDLATGFTVRDLARRYRVGVARVIGWIRRGELRAINRRDDRSCRPSFVVTPEALTDFERSRQVATPAPKPPRRKKRICEVDYFPD